MNHPASSIITGSPHRRRHRHNHHHGHHGHHHHPNHKIKKSMVTIAVALMVLVMVWITILTLLHYYYTVAVVTTTPGEVGGGMMTLHHDHHHYAMPHSFHDYSQQQHQQHQQLRKHHQQQKEEGVGGVGVGVGVDRTTSEVEEEEEAEEVVITVDEGNVVDMRNLSATLKFDDSVHTSGGGVWTQGWELSPKNSTHTSVAGGGGGGSGGIGMDKEEGVQDTKLQILVVPHSHCDPGWIQTFDTYFQQQTRLILTTIVTALHQDVRRTFVWAEISYLAWWWQEQDESMKQITIHLLTNGQLELVTGGWVQCDEANTQLEAMEIQLQEGHDFIKQYLGEQFVPQFGWSIDPFGYSPTMAYLLHKYQFKGMLIQRVHYAVKKELARHLHLEFMWRQTWDTEGTHDIFTHVMPFYSYDIPHTCGPDPSVCCQFDFARMNNQHGGCPWHKSRPQRITSQNVKERSLLLLDQYRKKASLYRGNAVLAPLGDDFRYMSSEEAEAQFVNYQLMMDYINEHVDDVSIRFGTLSDYMKAVQGTFDVPILKGSFFTYADREQDYWSGYFTSRIFDKALDRKLERVLYAATTLGATREEMQESRRALSLFQHHDGVTGTAKDHVVRDYAARIHNAIHAVQDWMIRKLKPNPDTPFDACWQSDAPRGLSQNLCGNEGQVYVYNPLETSQYCGDTEVNGHTMELVQLPCEMPGSGDLMTKVRFDPTTGLMTHPVQEHWMVWTVKKGGAYLFFPHHLGPYSEGTPKVELGGYVVTTPHWKRTVVQQQVSDEFGGTASVFDFIYETNLQTSNEEWLVRFSSQVQNKGIFHTDLNGFNFDTHYFRKDLPIQSQVFPMPTLASIEDKDTRMSVLSEHAQGTASLEDGSIDVWLDRRLAQDDERGLFQGVMDNVPTRTRLRLLLETEGYHTTGEFDITPLCRHMWDQLNHPLEMFGQLHYDTAQAAQDHESGSEAMVAALKVAQEKRRTEFEDRIDPGSARKAFADTLLKKKVRSFLSSDASAPIVPFVYMVHKRADTLKMAIDTLLASDFDRKRVPLIISHDGRVKEVMSYVDEIKSEFHHLIQIFHPFSCFDHPGTFPGNDEKLNDGGYKGDTYGNRRSGSVTCTKHHFTWMLKTVFGMNYTSLAILEEDYVVAPTIYETVVTGLRLLEDLSQGANDEDEGYFGLTLEGSISKDDEISDEGWDVNSFTSGPMVLTRDSWNVIQQNANEFCTYDDYNWDWSIVHLMDKGLVPSRALHPTVSQVMHIGLDGGTHGGSVARWQLYRLLHTDFPGPFHGTKLIPDADVFPKERNATKPYGGWGHPADHEHCLKVLLD